jgi:hypothetical protein
MTGVTRARLKPPSLITAFALLAFTDLALRLFGFARSVALVRKLAGKKMPEPTTRAATMSVCQRVITAGVFYPGRALCLEQSLVLFVLLRRRAVAAELRLGVQPYPFSAHAWVELDGVPLNETPETIRQFVPMPDFAR